VKLGVFREKSEMFRPVAKFERTRLFVSRGLNR
jgi:hypothetical protein